MFDRIGRNRIHPMGARDDDSAAADDARVSAASLPPDAVTLMTWSPATTASVAMA